MSKIFFFTKFAVKLECVCLYVKLSSLFLGANLNTAGEIIYLLKLKKNDSFEEKTSQQVKQTWPHLLVDFLQSRVHWNSLTHAFPGGNPIVETENPTGVPLRIICEYIIY